MGHVRPAAVAGMFYPGDRRELAAAVQFYLSQVQVPAGTPVPKAIIAPHAGYVYSGPVAATAYARMRPARGLIRRVVLLGPCHRVPVRGLAASGADAFATPLGPVPLDRAAIADILTLPQVAEFDPTHAQEHSLEVHLPFLQTVLDDFALVPLVVGQAGAEEVAQVLDRLWGGPETLIVVSSDLSHYLDYDTARRLDGETCRAIETLDPAALGRDQACGRIPVGGLLTLARRKGMQVSTVDLRNSGDTAGDKARVVGYGAWVFVEPRATQALRGEADFGAGTRALLDRLGADLLRLAARSIVHGLQHGRPLAVDPAAAGDPALAAKGACFVTLKKDGRLRGCIGSPLAHRPLLADVAENAFAAAFRDHRFAPLAADEVADLTLSIAVLSPPAPIACDGEAGLLAALRPGTDGLIIEDHGRRALFLPAVWAELPEPVRFLQHLKIKAGLSPGAAVPGLKAWRFVSEEVSSADLDDPAALWAALPG
ncbi:MAG: AmmeMemoRadiSam system protein B [Hyphomicrobiales bacterium]|nr:AmmeMemoRadiSam system protein B [Hyphomicrobiales bacterium]MCP5372537.1 AmmeMemoRadiSam system protein B [Hyphomicrobiales bacterium]